MYPLKAFPCFIYCSWLNNSSTRNGRVYSKLLFFEQTLKISLDIKKSEYKSQDEALKVSECMMGCLLTLLIMLRVHSKTASKICGISPVMWAPSLLTMIAMVLSTSGSRAAGTFR